MLWKSEYDYKLTILIWLSFFCTPLIFFFGLVLGVFINYHFDMDWQLIIDASTFIVLTFTLVFVARAAYIAQQQNRQMIRQTNLKILPSFQLIIEPDTTGRLKSIKSIQNVGNGVALNVEFKTKLGDDKDVKLVCHYSKISPNEKVTLTRSDHSGGVQGLKEHLLGIEDTVTANFKFDDIEGNKYMQNYRFADNKHYHDYVAPLK